MASLAISLRWICNIPVPESVTLLLGLNRVAFILFCGAAENEAAKKRKMKENRSSREARFVSWADKREVCDN